MYDADGNMIQETDAKGQVTVFEYDSANRETGEQWYTTPSKTSAYDNLGRLVTTTQPTANGVTPVTRYTYDADGNELSETDPDNNQTTYTYNGLNQRVSQTQSSRPFCEIGAA